MYKLKAIGAAIGACSLAVVSLSACAPDQMIWGAEGAEVRALAEQFIEDAAISEEPEVACAEADLRFGASEAWDGLTAGEPEQYTGDDFEEFGHLSPTWLINLSPIDSDESAGVREVPTYLFYRGSGEALCVVGVSWGARSTSP